jgi:hypothetical protein
MRPPPKPFGPSPLAVFMAFVAPILISLLASVLLSHAAAADPREKNEPKLILPGNRAVRAGQLIDLRWAPTDSVSELEILLSVDGGRHYSLCISPQLDPARCHFVWRVPNLGEAQLRMRIRFNRGGRETEGAPTAPLLLLESGSGQAEPLALPAPEGPGRGAPKPTGDRGEGPASRSGSLEASDDTLSPRQTSSRGEGSCVSSPEIAHPMDTASLFATPRLVLRI